jgi:hypothetical protein
VRSDDRFRGAPADPHRPQENTMKHLVVAVLMTASAAARADCGTTGQPWYMTKAPADTAQESTVHVLLTAPAPIVVRVCYCSGVDDTYIRARTSTIAANVQVTQIYKGGCADLGGTSVWLSNPNGTPVSGKYEPVTK